MVVSFTANVLKLLSVEACTVYVSALLLAFQRNTAEVDNPVCPLEGLFNVKGCKLALKIRKVLKRVSVSVPLFPVIPTKYSPGVTLARPVTVIVTVPEVFRLGGLKEAVAPAGNPVAENVVVPAPDCV